MLTVSVWVPAGYPSGWRYPKGQPFSSRLVAMPTRPQNPHNEDNHLERMSTEYQSWLRMGLQRQRRYLQGRNRGTKRARRKDPVFVSYHIRDLLWACKGETSLFLAAVTSWGPHPACHPCRADLEQTSQTGADPSTRLESFCIEI